MNNTRHFLLNILFYLTTFTSSAILIYINLTHVIKLFAPAENFIDRRVFDPIFLNNLLILSLLLSLIGWIGALFSKRIKFIAPQTYNYKNNLPLLLTAFFFSVFFHKNYFTADLLNYLSFFLLFLLFLLIFPQIEQLYLSLNIDDLKTLPKLSFTLKHNFLNNLKEQLQQFGLIKAYFLHLKLKSSYAKKKSAEESADMKQKEYFYLVNILRLFVVILFGLISSIILIISLVLIVNLLTRYLEGGVVQENLSKNKFTITNIIPDYPMHAQKVRIEGYNFGWKQENDYRFRVMTQQGPIRLIEVWTNEWIEFIVPIEFPAIKTKLWIERPGDDAGKNPIIKSNQFPLRIYSRFKLYPRENDPVLIKAIKKVKRYIYTNYPYFSNLMLLI